MKKIKPFLILQLLATIGYLIIGILSLSWSMVFFGIINTYFTICIYSFHQIVEFEGEQGVCHQNAADEGYAQCYEPETETYNNAQTYGYQQTSEFQGP